MYSASDHTFALCAYKESPYLGKCLDSLMSQSVKTNVLVATATPNDYIQSECERYDVPLYVHDAVPGIASDWNFAMACACTSLVTIAHQDDLYEPLYAERMLDVVNEADHPLIYFTNYGELRNDEYVNENRLLRIKRMMLTPLKGKTFRTSRFVRRRILSLGSAICCPSVTAVIPNVPVPLFLDDMKCDLDWQAWESVSRLEGSFLYNSDILMYHRIHEESETSALIEDNTRTLEDMAMLERFWPKPIASLIGKIYVRAQKSNG